MAEQSRTEEFPVVDGIALRLAFTPDAIRDHFDIDDTPEAGIVAALDDDALARIGVAALSSDALYETFHRVLVDAVRDHQDTATD